MEWKEPTDQMKAALDAATGEIGVSEDPKGSNRGPRIEEYLATVGLPGGYAWCAAFISWCIKQAEEKLALCIDVKKSAWTPDYLKATGCTVCKGDPKEIAPGTLFLLFYKSKNRVAHIGMIEGPHPSQPDRVLTIEGNSNDEGSREGYEVCRRSRRITDIYALITY